MKTDNELIAEFMGLVRHEADATYNLPQYYRPENDKRKKGSFVGYPEQLKYATSWAWLMPVVEKINETVHPILKERIDVIIYRRTCHVNDMQQIIIETTGKNMLDATYKAVVEFIKWYNSQPK